MSENESTAPLDRELKQGTVADQGAIQAQQYIDFIRRRTEELKTEGMPEGRARGIAMLEHRIAEWPLEWGNKLRIIIYGDFQPPQTDLHFHDLGMVVEADPVKGSIARSAMCVLKARVTVGEKSITGLVDASARVNVLLSVLAALDWGNSGNGWWCRVTHGSPVGVIARFDEHSLVKAIEALEHLQPELRRQVISALYWIREPRQMMMEGYRSDALRVYAGYWNAFECLVEAVCILRPPLKLSKRGKQEEIDQFLAERGGRLDPDSLSEIYRNIVNPGFRAKASHALRQCFPDRADRYIVECFTTKPEQDRLYDIRNAISHGEIAAEDIGELIRVEDKQTRLWMIVFGMLAYFIPVPRPNDSEPN